MNLIWNSSTLGTLDLGRNKLKRAKRAWSASIHSGTHDQEAFNRLLEARTNVATKTDEALKRARA